MKFFMIAVLMVVALCGATADAATARHEIGVEIARVKMLEVQNNWETQSVSETESGGTRAIVATTYGVTNIVEDTVIQAILATPLPDGMSVRMRMSSTIGTSLGWVPLAGGTAGTLVYGPKGNEFNVVEMELTVPFGVSPSAVPLRIQYVID